MARPKKKDEERKTFTIRVRVTAEQKERLEKAANYCGYANVSAYIRDMANRDTVGTETDYI